MHASGRVAVLNDIHGNLPALEAVLREIRGEGIDRVVIGGDVLPGPMPFEAMTMLLGLDVPVHFIRGNGDREVLAVMEGGEASGVPVQFRPMIAWNAERLTREHQQQLASWPLTLTLAVPGLDDVLFCHATPRNDVEVFTRLTPEERLVPIFGGLGVSTVVCGHTHMQFDRMIGGVRVLNAGSVGMPFDAPGAAWLVLGPGVELRRARYDYARAAEQVRATGFPDAQELAVRYILSPPTEEETLELFSSRGIVMSSATLLVRLKFGSRAWNLWRQENPDEVIVLDGAVLDGMILTGIDFSNVSLRGASLHAANLMNADLRGADFTGANLVEADLISAKLQGATLTGANLREADLLGADLSGAHFSADDLEGALHAP